MDKPLDLRVIEARLKGRQKEWEKYGAGNPSFAADDDCEVLLAHCRALRAALERESSAWEQLRDRREVEHSAPSCRAGVAKDRWTEAGVEENCSLCYMNCKVERAAAVLAQVIDK